MPDCVITVIYLADLEETFHSYIDLNFLFNLYKNMKKKRFTLMDVQPQADLP